MQDEKQTNGVVHQRFRVNAVITKYNKLVRTKEKSDKPKINTRKVNTITSRLNVFEWKLILGPCFVFDSRTALRTSQPTFNEMHSTWKVISNGLAQ